MKSGVKGFWKKQKYVVRRHKPSSFVVHCSSPLIDFSKIDNGLSVDIGSLRAALSVEVCPNGK